MNAGQIFLFFLVGTLSAADHLVEDEDSLRLAAKHASPGDRIVCATNGNWKDVQLKLKLSDVTLTAEKVGEVAFEGQSAVEIIGKNVTVDGLIFRNGHLETGHVLRIRGEHCRVTRCSILGYNPPKSSTRYHWLSLQGHHHRVDHCRFSNHNHSGNTICVWLDGDEVGEHRIEFNYFGPRVRGEGNGFEVIRIGDSKTSLKVANCVVAKNLFEKCDGEIELISNKSCGNWYIGNTIVNSAGCLTLRHGNKCTVSHNLIFGEGRKGSGGIRVVGEDHVIRNNHIEATDGRTDGAIAISAGVVNAKLNQHAQVKRLLVEGNRLFDNRGGNFCIGHGKGSHSRTLMPVDYTIRNNDEQPGPSDLLGYRLSALDVGPEAFITPHSDAIPGEPGDLRAANAAWIVPSSKSLIGIVLDETDAVLQGEWQYSAKTPPYVGSGYLHDRKSGKGDKSVTWTFLAPESGRYRVEISHAASSRHATNTPVSIKSAQGEVTVEVNQQEQPSNGKLFRVLGDYHFEKETPGLVVISNRGTDDKLQVIADSVRFTPVAN